MPWLAPLPGAKKYNCVHFVADSYNIMPCTSMYVQTCILCCVSCGSLHVYLQMEAYGNGRVQPVEEVVCECINVLCIAPIGLQIQPSNYVYTV